MSDTGEDNILELRELYVGYYRDLNILQNLNIKARKNQITAILGANRGWQVDCDQSSIRLSEAKRKTGTS